MLELREKGDVMLDMVDKQSEDYVPPPPPSYVAFSGSGSSLGPAAVASTAVIVQPNLGPVPHPPVDQSSPVTTIQIRTFTGQRLKITLNTTATTTDLANAIRR
jgi:UBX domain-containing protein 1